MRTMKHWALAAAAAAALALAGCGGGGGGSSSTTPTTPTTPTDPPPSALSFATDLNSSVDALTALSGDAATEGSALMMAKDASEKIGTLTSDGNSMAAMNNAAMVLKAKADLMAAIEAAETDKMEAEAAKADTEDADVIAALDAAIMKAEDEIEAAQAVLDGDDLAMYVDMVTGGDDADPMGTPESIGKDVAMAVAMALAPASSTNGLGARLNPDPNNSDAPRILAGAMPPDTVKDANKYGTDDHQGMTWMEITGASMKTRITTADNNTKEVYISSIAGMDGTDLNAALTATGGTNSDGMWSGGDEIDTSTYKGIAGTVICMGGSDGCSVNADGELSSGWYFTPTYDKAQYTKGADGTYALEAYVQYGHWLVVAENGDVSVNTYASLLQPSTIQTGATDAGTGSWVGPNPASTDAGMRASSAIYEGTAAGRSVHKTLDGNGDVTAIQSGRFTASVTLTATFAAGASTLGGKVMDFMSPDNPGAVDPDWTVTLNNIATADGSVTAGVADASGQDGVWTATSYGTGTSTDVGPTTAAPDGAGRRPTGIYGGFNAHFTDGHVAGAYATRR